MRAVCMLLFALSVVVPAFAKQQTTKIVISGGELGKPIEITDANILAKFRVWTGPGTSTNDNQSLVVDWSYGPIAEPPKALRRYQVSFYAGGPESERVVYVVCYAFVPGHDPGYIYLPGDSDEYFGLNVRSVFRGVEGRWFKAWSEWEAIARPLIESPPRNAGRLRSAAGSGKHGSAGNMPKSMARLWISSPITSTTVRSTSPSALRTRRVSRYPRSVGKAYGNRRPGGIPCESRFRAREFRHTNSTLYLTY
jgi:hypothetical protein